VCSFLDNCNNWAEWSRFDGTPGSMNCAADLNKQWFYFQAQVRRPTPGIARPHPASQVSIASGINTIDEFQDNYNWHSKVVFSQECVRRPHHHQSDAHHLTQVDGPGQRGRLVPDDRRLRYALALPSLPWP
jgi:hypothetical protein